MILLLCFIFIYSHLLLLFLLIKLDNVRSSLFWLSLSFTIFFRVFFLLTNPEFTSYKPRVHFLQTPSYKIIFLDLFKIYVSVYQFIMILLLCFIFIYSHLLLLFLLIKLDNVRSSLFWLSLSFLLYFLAFFSSYKPRVSFYTF